MNRPLVLCVVALLAGAWPARAAESYLWDESHVSLAAGVNPISDYVVADDFVVTESMRLQQALVWLSEEANDSPGIFEGFSGSIGWAIYADSAGNPGGLVYSGTDSSPQVEAAGFTQGSGEVFRVYVHFPDTAVLAATGTYWLAIHEGAWGSTYDFSTVDFLSVNQSIGSGARSSTNLASPGNWSGAGVDNAFVILGDRDYWHQASYNFNLAEGPITGSVLVNDFALVQASKVGDVEFWVADGVANDNGQFDSFNGSISWALYSDSSGHPAASPFRANTDRHPRITDTGLQDAFGADVFRVRIHLDAGVDIPTGLHWLALHEGPWYSASDGSPLGWIGTSTSAYGADQISLVPTNPVTWYDFGSETAFVLYTDTVFSAGFESGSICSWSPNSRGASCP